MKKLATAVLAVAGLSTLLGLGASAASASATPAVRSYTVTATTSITNRPDSGDNGNWAYDGTKVAPLKRTASLTLVKAVPLASCGGHTGTGHCYEWAGKVSDAGDFVTIPGATSPGSGSLNGAAAPKISAAATGTMKGSITYAFFSSWKTASTANWSKTENDKGNAPSGNSLTGIWPMKFFGPGAQFYQGGVQVTLSAGTLEAPGGAWAWTYTLGLGAVNGCPNLSSQWVDSSAGSTGAYGNILDPAAPAC